MPKRSSGRPEKPQKKNKSPAPVGTGAKLLVLLQYIWLMIRVAIYLATYHLRG